MDEQTLKPKRKCSKKFSRRVFRFGGNHHKSKLTDREIELIRRLREDGMSATEIAEKFEVNKDYVYKICNYTARTIF